MNWHRYTLTSASLLSLLTSCGDDDAAKLPSSPQEMYDRANYYLKPNAENDTSKPAEAMSWLTQAAEAGHLQAQQDLGGIYLEGSEALNLKPDPAKAFHWFTRAAEQGSNPARYYLGLMLWEGLGVKEDKTSAMEHWRAAAQAGVPEAQCRLGAVLFADEATRAEGLELLRKAALAGHSEAQYRLGSALVMEAATVAEGIDWLKKAAAGKPLSTAGAAARTLGALYAKGAPGVPADIKAAAEWYGRAADCGDARAQHVFALLLLNGQGVETDVARGMAFLRMSAGQNYLRAIADLVNLLRNMEDADLHAAEAEAWARRLDELMQKKK